MMSKFDSKLLKNKCVEVKAVYKYVKTGATVTMSYLIAPDGTIIAKNLRGDQLNKKLAEIFE